MTETAASAPGTAVHRSALLGQLGTSLRRFGDNEASSAILLVIATVAAVAWANSPWSDSYFSLWSTIGTVSIGDHAISMDLRTWVSDGLMAIFFFVIGLEVRHELSVGQLKDHRLVRVPFAAAVGGLVVPAVLYLLLNPSNPEAKGWGAVVGTDTAFLLGSLTLVGPSASTQLRLFLMTMTIADDLLAVTIIALLYSGSLQMGDLALAAAMLAVFALLDWLRVWRIPVYAAAGIVLWVATVESGVHSSIAGMLAGLLVSAHLPRRDEVDAVARVVHAFRQSPTPSVGSSATRGLQRAVSVNERMQILLHPWTSYVIVPVFALANAGVDLRGGLLADALQSPVMWGVVLGLVVGKFVGISATTFASMRLRLGTVPQGVGPGQVLGGAALSGMGFTVALLIIGLALDDPKLRDEATVGVLLAAALSFVTGWIAFRLAASLHGETSAELPTILDPPVDLRRDHVRGAVDARLTLVEYGDFECPFCGAATTVLEEIRERFGDRVRYVFRHLPLEDVHPHAMLAAEASEAAAAQGCFWEMHDVLFDHQQQLEYEDLLGYADDLGLDVEEFARALSESRYAGRVRDDLASAERSGARRTPTFFINGLRHRGPWDTQSLAAALEAAASAMEAESI